MVLLQVAFFLLPLIQADDKAAVPTLSNVKRTIVKEPKYSAPEQGYCLLVFGPQAATQVWLVVDGTRLYVDRNSDGDLTGVRERVEGSFDVGRSEWIFQDPAFRVIDGKPTTLQVVINVDGDHDSVSTTCNAESQSNRKNTNRPVLLRLAGVDSQGKLRFSSRPVDAPVIWFDGPLQMSLRAPQTLHRDDRRPWFSAAVGTPGIGAGSFAAISYSGVPKDLHPFVELIGKADENGVRKVDKFFLEDRC